jgi:hypothetical protein
MTITGAGPQVAMTTKNKNPQQNLKSTKKM